MKIKPNIVTSSAPLQKFIFQFFLLSSTVIFAQNDWENSTIFERNKEPGHATFVPLNLHSCTINFSKEKSPYIKILNGDWKFNWVPKPADRPMDFYRPEFDVTDWKEISVPSNWQLHSYGNLIYTWVAMTVEASSRSINTVYWRIISVFRL